MGSEMCIRDRAFKTWPQRPLTSHQHPNVVSPLTAFSAPQLSTGPCTSVDNVVVLPSTNVVDFRQYWHDQQNSEHLEYCACLTLARLLSAALYLHERSAEMPRLLPRRVVMAMLDTGECYPMLRQSTRSSKSSDVSAVIADDISEMISVMLQLENAPKSACGDAQRRKSDTSMKWEKPAGVDVAAAISPQSSYSRCLQRIVRCVRHKNDGHAVESLKESIRLLEFTLFGPSEDEARMIAVSYTHLTLPTIYSV